MQMHSGITNLLVRTLLVAGAAISVPATAQRTVPSAITAVDAGRCLDPTEIVDPSTAVSRNRVDLASSRLCVMHYEFDEGGLGWRFLVVREISHPDTVLWVVPHDDEGAAFDSAVLGVRRYGGTVVAVKTGGERLNHGQDPNRNFDLGSGPLCPAQRSRSPLYTAEVLRWRGDRAPVVGLHTNDKGFEGDGKGGRKTVSIRLSSKSLKPFPAPHAMGASPDDTMVYVASTLAPGGDAGLMRLVNRLNARRINVAYELVSRAWNDCSLSNYSVLAGTSRYFNVEAVHGDAAGHRAVMEILMSEIGVAPLGN